MKPRMLLTVDAEGQLLSVPVRVGQAVDVVAQAGRPKTITGGSPLGRLHSHCTRHVQLLPCYCTCMFAYLFGDTPFLGVTTLLWRWPDLQCRKLTLGTKMRQVHCILCLLHELLHGGLLGMPAARCQHNREAG